MNGAVLTRAVEQRDAIIDRKETQLRFKNEYLRSRIQGLGVTTNDIYGAEKAQAAREYV